jgi:site-specific DNA recombinase
MASGKPSEAYIKSQAHEGWRFMRDRYDDGGFSGGSMERPALTKLLDAVRARRVDVIVVYKVDRLTHSLADFAKLVELFDEHQVSFRSPGARSAGLQTRRTAGLRHGQGAYARGRGPPSTLS